MTDKVRITIAATLTALFIAAASTAGLLARAEKAAPVAASTVPAAVSTPQPVQALPLAPARESHDEHD
jgi:hypothetical protein